MTDDYLRETLSPDDAKHANRRSNADQEPALGITERVVTRVNTALKKGLTLPEAIAMIDLPIAQFQSQYQPRDDNRKEFSSMLRLFIYKYASGLSQNRLATRFSIRPKLSDLFGFESPPVQQCLSYTKRERLSSHLRQTLKDVGEAVALTVIELGVDYEELCIEPDAMQPTEAEQRQHDVAKACDVVFEPFSSERGEEARFDDQSFLRQYAYAAMAGSGTGQGSRRYNWSGDGMKRSNHDRIVNRFSEDDIDQFFQQSVKHTIDNLRTHPEFKLPLEVAFDITPMPYWANVGRFPARLSGTRSNEDARYCFKYATATVVGENIPIILSIVPVIENSEWNGSEYPSVISDSRADTVRKLFRRIPARLRTQITNAYGDRGFTSAGVCSYFERHDITYLLPKAKSTSDKNKIRQLNFLDRESYIDKYHGLHLGGGNYTDTDRIYIPKKGWNPDEDELEQGHENKVVFVTNADLDGQEDSVEEFVFDRYGHRWRIENQFKTLKNQLHPDVRSYKTYVPRRFAFTMTCLFHNAWRVTNLYRKRREEDVYDYESVPMAANEFADAASNFLGR